MNHDVNMMETSEMVTGNTAPFPLCGLQQISLQSPSLWIPRTMEVNEGLPYTVLLISVSDVQTSATYILNWKNQKQTQRKTPE